MSNPRWEAIVSSLRLFLDRWLVGVKITIQTIILGAFVIASGGLVGVLLYGFCIVLPVEALLNTDALEHYWVAAFLLGCAVWGVAGVGRARHIMAEVFTE